MQDRQHDVHEGSHLGYTRTITEIVLQIKHITGQVDAEILRHCCQPNHDYQLLLNQSSHLTLDPQKIKRV